jgi:hypothetical protein
MHRTSVSLIAPIILLTGLAVPAAARAEGRRVVVLGIEGQGGKRVREFLTTELESKHTVVPSEAFKEAASELEIRRNTMAAQNLRRIARRAYVDAVVSGWVYRSQRQWWLAIQVRDGGTGKLVKQGIVSFPGFSLMGYTKAALMKVVLAGIEKVDGVPPPPRRRRVEPEVRPEPERPPPRAKAPLGERPANLTALSVGLGVEIFARKLVIQPGSDLVYETNTPVAPIAFSVEVFPGAFVSRHQVYANLGIGITFARAFGVISYRENTSERIVTTIQNAHGYLTYRLFGNRKPTSPVVHLDLGIDAREFSFGDVDLGVVPGVQYISFRPGIRAYLPLGTERLRLGLGLSGLIAAQLGQLGDAWHYGAGPAGGFEASLELDVRIVWKLHLVVGARTTWMFVRFKQASPQEYRYPADTARDGFYGGYAQAVIRY